jgi:hypothetical protein
MTKDTLTPKSGTKYIMLITHTPKRSVSRNY